MAAEALDPGVVLDKLKHELVGRYYTVSGHKLDRYILTDTITLITTMDKGLLEEILTELEMNCETEVE
jgi:replication factor A1